MNRWPTYEIWSDRHYPVSAVQVDYRAETLQLDEALRERISELCRQRRAEGRRVENLPLYRVTAFTLEESLVLRAGLTDYEEYLGLSGLGIAQPEALSLVVSMATRVPEGWILEERSSQVAEGGGLLHVKPSGHAHPGQTPWQACIREAEEELALHPEELLDPLCLGLVRSRVAQCLALIFHCDSPVSLEEIRSRVPQDHWESVRLFCLPDEPEALRDWLLENRETIAGIGHASLLLAGGRRYGADWLERTRTALSLEGPIIAPLDAVSMYRPIGPSELVLLEQNGFSAWPPRRPDQPIFYPVTNVEYAREITVRWNVPSYGSGYVTRFLVKRIFAEQFDIECVGAERHTEWWIPAERLEELNAHLLGPIELLESYPEA